MKFLSDVFADVKKGENIDVYLTIVVSGIVVILDLFGLIETSVVTSAILLTLGLLALSTLTTRKTVSDLDNSVKRIGGAGIEILDAKVTFPHQITLRAKQVRKYILDTNLNQEILRASTTSPQDEYRKIRDDRVLKHEISFRRVEVVFHKEHLESVIRRLLKFEGCEFYIRHYDAPPQAIPVLHLMSFDDEHFYLGGYYPSDPSTEEKVIYIRSNEMAELMREYWQMLWMNGKPLNEGKIINWAELKRIGARIGISNDDFDNLVIQIKNKLEQEKRQSYRKK